MSALARAVPLPALPPHLWQRLLAVAAALALLAATYLLWLRDSGLVRVDEVKVTGLTTDDAGKVRAALAGAARGMTTLHVRNERLEKAAAAFPVVRSLEVRADFPDGIRIHVLEHHPVALAVSGGSKVPLAADGSVLRGLPIERSLPLLKVRGALPPERIGEAAKLRLLRVVASAPAPLAARLAGVRRSPRRGIVVAPRDGPELVFGDAARLRAKWAAAGSVLADQSSRGASYVDLRMPERPAAGGLAVETVQPVAPLPADPQP